MDLSPGEATSGGVLLTALGWFFKQKWDQVRNGKARLSKVDYDQGVRQITEAIDRNGEAIRQAVRDINSDHREVMNTYLAETKVQVLESEGRIRGSRA